MKSLYLSSYGFGRAPDALAALVGSGSRAALVMNALDVYGPRLPAQVAANVSGLSQLGIEATEVDLRTFFGDEHRLRQSLSAYQLIWAVGGNSFVLRRALRASGLDRIASERVEEGSLVWSGFSAGSVVATPTLAGIELVDDPNVVPDGYEGVDLVWEGLGFVNYSIAPHYRSDHPESGLIEDVVARFERDGVPYRALRDGEAIVIRGGEERLVGSTSE
jgi:dipeptidase E